MKPPAFADGFVVSTKKEMNVIQTDIEGLLILEPAVFGDHRGYFLESFSRRDFDRIVPGVHFVQDNESGSGRGVLRGFHFQKGPHAQSKLVRVPAGRVLDVAVDLRPGSPSFGRHAAVELSAENKRMFFIPKGFAHAYIALEDHTVFQYKCDAFYEPASCGTLLWNDPELGISWPLPAGEIILSATDRNGTPLARLRREMAEGLWSSL